MSPKKEPLPDPKQYCPIRDKFWSDKNPSNPEYDYKDWAIEKPTKTKKEKK